MNKSCKLLNKIYQNAKTGAETINILLLKLNSEDFRILLLAQKEKYLKIATEAEEALAENGVLPSKEDLFGKIGLLTVTETNIFGRDEKAAETIVNACTEGIIEITRLLNSGEYKPSAEALAHKIIDTEQKSMYFAQAYL